MPVSDNLFSHPFLRIIDKIKREGKDPFNLNILLKYIRGSGVIVSRDEVLSFILSNKRLGYHSTPNNIAELMAEIGSIFKPESVIDISCGLANTLAYVDYTNDLTGIDIDGEIISITKYLLPELNLINADSLRFNFKRKYDLVISNFPYGFDLNETGHKTSIEALFVNKALTLLNSGGVLVCILPDVFLKTKTYEKVRENILNNFSLEMVVQLPAGIIQNVYIIPAIVVIKNKKQREKVLLTDYNAKENIIENYTNEKGKSWIKAGELKNNWDPQYHLQENNFIRDHEFLKSKPLSEMADVRLGCMLNTKDLKPEGEILFLRPKNIIKGSFNLTEDDKYLRFRDVQGRYKNFIVKPGDVLISRIFKNEAKVYVYKSTDPPAVASNTIYIVRSYNSDYLASYLNTENGNKVLREQIKQGTEGFIAPVISAEGLRNIKIPIIPMRDLNQLGDNYINSAEEKKLQEIKEELRIIISDHQELKKHGLENSAKLDLMSNRFDAIELRLKELDDKLDSILLTLNKLATDFKDTRQLKRGEDEIINRLYLLIDEKMKLMKSETDKNYEFYIREIKHWLDRWDDLESESKQFVPQAEFLYDQLAKLKDADYSPFIVQYSRALENEILIKLFQAYHKYLIASNINRIQLTIDDMESSNTKKFAKFVRSDIRTYTLGDMSFIMQLMKDGGKTIGSSKLLQDFKLFSNKYFEIHVFEKEFLEKVTLIVEKYRNKAAHPNILSNEIAQEFHIRIKECLSALMGNYKSMADSN